MSPATPREPAPPEPAPPEPARGLAPARGEALAPNSVPGPAPAPAPRPTLSLFEGFGVEIEWMIVDADSLEVRPVGDRLLGDEGEVERGTMAWSNELVLHVLEAKTHGPASALEGLADAFHGEVLEAERRLEPLGCRLLGGGVHPWMDPGTETRIWPHETTEVYRAFDRIFGVAGHGWANLQSTHLNLPFSGDAEFAALHQAIRLVLPLIPALSAASPVLDGVVQPNLDERMERYRLNARRIPLVCGGVIPQVVRSRQGYEDELLAPLYRELAPHDPEGILRHEWVNARGSIARFQRGAVEIRVVDAQESPLLDLAVLTLVVAAVRKLVATGLDHGKEGGVDRGEQRSLDPTQHRAGRPSPLERPETAPLQALLAATVRHGDRGALGATASINALVDLLGVADRRPRTAGEVWWAVAEDAALARAPGVAELLARGPLARRILEALAGVGAPTTPGSVVPRGAMREVWGEMAQALRRNRVFLP